MIETIEAPGWGIFDIHVEKPSWADAPEWANWLAMDMHGCWEWFEQKPYIHQYHWESDGQSCLHNAKSNIRSYGWVDTLEKRPISSTWSQRITDSEQEAELLDDMVNHPAHYAKQGEIECIEVLEQLAADVHDFRILNAMKYLWRYRHKGGDESISKAIWYLRRYLAD